MKFSCSLPEKWTGSFNPNADNAVLANVSSSYRRTKSRSDDLKHYLKLVKLDQAQGSTSIVTDCSLSKQLYDNYNSICLFAWGSSIKDVRTRGEGVSKADACGRGVGLKENADVRKIKKKCQIDENLLKKMFNN